MKNEEKKIKIEQVENVTRRAKLCNKRSEDDVDACVYSGNHPVVITFPFPATLLSRRGNGVDTFKHSK